MTRTKAVYRTAVAHKAQHLTKITVEVLVAFSWLVGLLGIALAFHSSPSSIPLELAAAGMAFGFAGMLSPQAKRR